MKRGVGTIELVIIFLVLGLILLGLYSIMTGKTFGQLFSATSCSGRGGTCIDATATCSEKTPVPAEASDCHRADKKQCCVPLGG